MAMKHHPPEFKTEAVALYRNRPDATIKSVADDLGVNSETLRNTPTIIVIVFACRSKPAAARSSTTEGDRQPTSSSERSHATSTSCSRRTSPTSLCRRIRLDAGTRSAPCRKPIISSGMRPAGDPSRAGGVHGELLRDSPPDRVNAISRVFPVPGRRSGANHLDKAG
ncbi:transposase [Umezawaea sp. Da 62-37]|uniref:transposase n=1 Tax=Umezawaea sp. Da 62-37 TaxID=3075927 RepID=UPI0028F731B7|nr:transposase [Umezawaea sp. Da 62-37]WNV85285.1 transposase [Umezawaea sp. Da 62-37]